MLGNVNKPELLPSGLVKGLAILNGLEAGGRRKVKEREVLKAGRIRLFVKQNG